MRNKNQLKVKYKHTHPLLPPSLYISHIDGKKYIVPGWKEVHPDATFDDIEWVREKIIVKKTKIETFEFPSSSGSEIYITKKYINPDGSIKYGCNCPGIIRSADRKCKHVKSLENGKIK
jgi:hypothetical protein